MRDVNKVMLVGRLGADPVRKETKTGTVLVQFPLATARRIRETAESEATEETQWLQVFVWGKEGESCAKFLKKGYTALVDGAVRIRSYKTQEGETRRVFEVHANEVNFLMRPKRDSDVPTEEALPVEAHEAEPALVAA